MEECESDLLEFIEYKSKETKQNENVILLLKDFHFLLDILLQIVNGVIFLHQKC